MITHEEQMRIQKEKFINVLFYSFLIAMLFFAFSRLFGIELFINNYEVEIINRFTRISINSLLKFIEAIFILKMLSMKTSWRKCALISLLYCLCIATNDNQQLIFTLDIIFTFSIPLFLNGKKHFFETLASCLILFAFISVYQIIMMFGLYEFDINGKFNLSKAIASIIDYKLFVITLYLFLEKRRLNMGDGSHCFFFWGAKETAIAVCATVLFPITFVFFGIKGIIKLWKNTKKPKVVKA